MQEHFSERSILQRAGELLLDCGLLRQAEAGTALKESCSRIASDGSTRRFWRLQTGDGCSCLIAAPSGVSQAELAESRSAWLIGTHLAQKGVPVPAIYGWDATTGMLLFEDLGDLRLHDLVIKSREDDDPAAEEAIIAFYHSALEMLARMQCAGSEGFDPSWCWDSPRYDRSIMLEKESGYFLRAFWQGLLGHEIPAGVEEELQEIAGLATEAPADFFLHRDFQSRNIMIKEARVRFIDFQGGRLGPLGYDLASLLIDPYSRLPRSLQEELLAVYKKAIGSYIPLIEAEFNRHFTLLAFQRNMQIVGAFSFLSTVRKKPFFRDFIKPSLLSLKERLEDQLFSGFPLIRRMVDRGLGEMLAAEKG